MSGAQEAEVADADADQRLDRWLRRRFHRLPQSWIERMCRKGELRVDGVRAKASTRLAAGQTVRIPPISDAEASGGGGRSPATPPADAEMIRAAVIHRDEHVIALNKPSGLAVQGGSGVPRHIDAMADALRFGMDESPRLVHRLDSDTSGVLLMARTRRIASALAAAFRRRETRKTYWAAVAGAPRPAAGTIRYALARAPEGGPGGMRRMLCVHPRDIGATPGAKPAATLYRVLAAAGRRAAWVALSPITGRTHQLRAHMAEIGHPVVGDDRYGGAGQTNPGDGWGARLGEGVGDGLHLHARSLVIAHPATGRALRLSAPLPDHMARTWDVFEWAAADAPDDPFEDAPAGAAG